VHAAVLGLGYLSFWKVAEPRKFIESFERHRQDSFLLKALSSYTDQDFAAPSLGVSSRQIATCRLHPVSKKESCQSSLLQILKTS